MLCSMHYEAYIVQYFTFVFRVSCGIECTQFDYRCTAAVNMMFQKNADRTFSFTKISYYYTSKYISVSSVDHIIENCRDSTNKWKKKITRTIGIPGFWIHIYNSFFVLCIEFNEQVNHFAWRTHRAIPLWLQTEFECGRSEVWPAGIANWHKLWNAEFEQVFAVHGNVCRILKCHVYVNAFYHISFMWHMHWKHMSKHSYTTIQTW